MVESISHWLVAGVHFWTLATGTQRCYSVLVDSCSYVLPLVAAAVAPQRQDVAHFQLRTNCSNQNYNKLYSFDSSAVLTLYANNH